MLLSFLCLTQLGGDLSLALIASLISYLVLIIFEIVCMSFLIPILGVTPEALLTDLFVRTLVTVPQVLLLFISAYFLKKYFKRGLDQ